VPSKLLKTLSLLLSFTLCSGAFAASLSIVDLKAGDRLSGKDAVSGKACSIQVVAKEDGMPSVTLKVGDIVYSTVVLEREPMISPMYIGAYTKETYKDNDGDIWVLKTEARLSQHLLNRKIRFIVTAAKWGEHNNAMTYPTIDCRDLN
jgi:hypothetical protein